MRIRHQRLDNYVKQCFCGDRKPGGGHYKSCSRYIDWKTRESLVNDIRHAASAHLTTHSTIFTEDALHMVECTLQGCGQLFEKLADLKNHRNKVHGSLKGFEDSFRCVTHGLDFNDIRALRHHLHHHHQQHVSIKNGPSTSRRSPLHSAATGPLVRKSRKKGPTLRVAKTRAAGTEMDRQISKSIDAFVFTPVCRITRERTP
eukprot:GHVU01128937.1.p1 GENE.GHVU01128937.1~~GHVU01128937.1.p1  ORF type:complete len:202 (+),score=12.63 GHVU01128937.1:1-606(+)